MSEKKDYFDYVTNVLGVKSILLNQDSSALLPVLPLLICVDDLPSYATAEKDLLVKMITALKIDLDLIKVVDLKQRGLFQPEFVIYFLDDLTQNYAVEVNAIKIYSAKVLLKDSQYKKQAWNDLQKVMLYFGNKTSQNR